MKVGDRVWFAAWFFNRPIVESSLVRRVFADGFEIQWGRRRYKLRDPMSTNGRFMFTDEGRNWIRHTGNVQAFRTVVALTDPAAF